MLQQIDILVPDELESALTALAARLGIACFQQPVIVPGSDHDEESVRFTGETTVSLLVSSVEQDPAAVIRAVRDLLAERGLPAAPVTMRTHRDDDWMRTFRELFQPIEVTERITIAPPLPEDAPPGTGEVGALARRSTRDDERAPPRMIIRIEPGMAFGTGTHETTRLCLEWLEQLEVTGQHWLDLGAGSGVLAIYLALRGAARVDAVELDGPAVENLRRNVSLNRVDAVVRIHRGDLLGFRVERPADGVVANVTSPVLLASFAHLATLVRPGARGVFSGVNTPNAPIIEQALTAGSGWSAPRDRREADWHAFLARRGEDDQP